MGQSSSSFMLSVIKTEVPLDCDDLAHKASIAAIWRTKWKGMTTRQIEQTLYGCRISECC